MSLLSNKYLKKSMKNEKSENSMENENEEKNKNSETIKYSKIIVKPSKEEIELHQNFIKKELKKNF